MSTPVDGISDWQHEQVTVTGSGGNPPGDTARSYIRYHQAGKTVSGSFLFTIATAGTGMYLIELPVAPVIPTESPIIIGSGFVFDSSTAAAYVCLLAIAPALSTTGAVLLLDAAAIDGSESPVNADAPITFEAVDSFGGSFVYEAD